MDIKTLTQKLESKINEKMEEIRKLGLKEQHITHTIEKLVADREEIYALMATVATELKPVEYIVKQNNPKIGEMFDELLKRERKLSTQEDDSIGDQQSVDSN